MLTINVDAQEVKQMVRDRISALVKEVDADMVFWDTKELSRRTSMSFETIQNNFFYDPNFPKHKVGGKWYYPARACRKFLETWIEEQPK